MSKNQLPSFRIDKRDFFKGNNAYDSYPEGGVLASTVGWNIFSKPGLLAQAPSLGSSVTASLPKNGCVAWCVGSGASAPSILALYANENDDGSWYTVNEATGAMTIVGSADTAHNYKLGISDSVFYNGKSYTTSETDIVEQNADGSSQDTTWWTTTKGQAALTSGVPHPLLVYESIMYIADGRYLHKVDGTTVSTQVFDVPPDHVITCMVEYNGLIYMVAEPYKNLTGTVHGLAQMFSWDGLLESWYEQYFLDYRVNALYVYKNRLYAWNNHFLGQWTGSEMAPIRPVASQVYKCHITATSDSMIYADGMTLVRYGAPFIPGVNRKFYKYLSTTGTNFTGIISAKDNSLIVTQAHATASPNYFISNINTPASSGSRTFDFNPRFFKAKVKIRGVVIETEALASGQKVKAGFIDEEGNEEYPTFSNGEFDNATSEMAGKGYFAFDISAKKAARSITPRIILTGNVHVKSVDYLYEGSES